MSFTRKPSVLIALLLSVVLLLGGFVYTLLGAGRSTFEIVDLEGDRQALFPFTISGALADPSHTQLFTIKNGVITTRFSPENLTSRFASTSGQYYSPPGHPYVYSMDFAFAPAPGAHVYEAPLALRNERHENQDGTTYQFTQKRFFLDKAQLYARIYAWDDKKQSFYESKIAQVKTGAVVHSEEERITYIEDKSIYGRPDPDDKERILTEITYDPGDYSDTPPAVGGLSAPTQESQCMTYLDGALYFILPTGQDVSGTGTIFRLKSLSDDLATEKTQLDETTTQTAPALEFGEVEAVASFPLNRGKTEVCGLFSSGDRLVVLLSIEGEIVLKQFDTSGRFYGDLTLPAPPDGTEYDFFNMASYPCLDGDTPTLCLWFLRMGTGAENPSVKDVFSLRLGDRPALIHRLSVSSDEGDISALALKGDTLLMVLEQWRALVPRPAVTTFPGEYDSIVLRVVGADGADLYRGELLTDQWQDLLRNEDSRTNDTPARFFLPFTLS